jgi:23S rRNA G2445 N2-methylase RlmL
VCGSGTIVIEAALIQADVAPGLIRYGPNSESMRLDGDERPILLSSKWPSVPADLWDHIYEEALQRDRRAEFLKDKTKPIIFANDIHRGSIELAIRASGTANVHRMIDFSCKDISSYRPKLDPNIILTNPPWDLRLDGAQSAWSKLGDFSRANTARDAAVWTLSGNPIVMSDIKLKSSKVIPFRSASLNMQFARYGLDSLEVDKNYRNDA